MKQWEMSKIYGNDPRIRFLLVMFVINHVFTGRLMELIILLMLQQPRLLHQQNIIHSKALKQILLVQCI